MADIISLRATETVLRISPSGGAIIDGSCRDMPYLRPYAAAPDGVFDVMRAASFPLVPFGNRLENNMFSFGGATHRMAANVAWDPLYLHGDGWLGEWEVVEQSSDAVSLAFGFGSPASPYRYRARQTFAVTPGALTVDLDVENAGQAALPFGLGHHLFLPLTPGTALAAPAASYWTERQGHLPGSNSPRPKDLEFDEPRLLPRRWINNGFEGWNGRAVIVWPENGLSMVIECDGVFGRYFLFLPTGGYGPTGRSDYFCFEPMTHSANGHHLPDLGGLTVLAPGERLSGRMRLLLRPGPPVDDSAPIGRPADS